SVAQRRPGRSVELSGERRMPRAKSNFFEQHIEKIVLAVSAIALVTAVVLYVVASPFKTSDGMGPGEVCDAVTRTADETREKVLRRAAPPPTKLPLKTNLQQVFGDCQDCGLIAMAKIQPVIGPSGG